MGWWKDFDKWASEPCLEILYYKSSNDEELAELKKQNKLLMQHLKQRELLNVTPDPRREFIEAKAKRLLR